MTRGRVFSALITMVLLALLSRVRETAQDLVSRVPYAPRVGAEGTGLEVLPPPVLEMIRSLQAQRASEFQMSAAVAANALWSQRLIEVAFPIRCRPKAPLLISASADEVPAGCVLLQAGDGMKLDRCP